MKDGADIAAVNLDAIPMDQRRFIDGSQRGEARLLTVAIGRGIYNPGWRWSAHAVPQTGKTSARHVGWILSGRMMVHTSDGLEMEVGPGDFFEVAPGHDAWVLGEEPCVALDFRGLN